MNKLKDKKIKSLFIIVMFLFILTIVFFIFKNKSLIKRQINTEKLEEEFEITYEEKLAYEDENKIAILIIVNSSNGIKKVIRPDGEEIYPVDVQRKRLALDYIVNADEDYIFKAIDSNNRQIEKIINVDMTKKIYTIEDLEEISNDLSRDYKLANSLDFKDRNSYRTDECYEYYNKDENEDGLRDSSWASLGTFSGTFNGNCKEIKNLYINKRGGQTGLFGPVTGTVKNLKLTDVDIYTWDSSHGAITPYNYGTIENVGVTGRVSAGSTAAKAIAYGNVGSIINCYGIGSFSHGNRNYYEENTPDDNIISVGGYVYNAYGININGCELYDGQNRKWTTNNQTMKNQRVYTQFDFDTLWEMKGYPRFKWEKDLSDDNIHLEEVDGEENETSTNLLTIDFTNGTIYYLSTRSADPNIVSELLFNKNTNDGGAYKGIMFPRSSSIEFTVNKKMKIYAYGHAYGDSAGSSGKNVLIQKYNIEDLEYDDGIECGTQADGNRYLLVTLEPGIYTMTALGNYVNFDEWEYEIIE